MKDKNRKAMWAKKKVECNLCQMPFDKSDKDYNHRVERHSEFHSKARIQKRNTTQGIPKYV